MTRIDKSNSEVTRNVFWKLYKFLFTIRYYSYRIQGITELTDDEVSVIMSEIVKETRYEIQYLQF